MRKKEYIHIHALLAEVTRYLIENGDMPATTISTYNTLDTRPTSIHRSKPAHDEAITVLGSAIEPWLEQAHTDSPGRSVNQPR